MLQKIRDNSQGWLVYAIIAVIGIAFSLLGFSSYLGGAGSNKVAEVNGVDISFQRFDQALRQRRQQLSQLFGANAQPEMFETEEFKNGVLDSLVRSEVLAQYTADNRYKASTSELLENIQTTPAFQEEGRFSKARYQQLLESRGMTPAIYEDQLIRQIQLQQMERIVGDTSFTTNDTIKNYLGFRNQKRDINYIVLSKESLKADIDITDEMINQEYTDNQQAYMTEEQVKIDYIEIDESVISQEVDTSEDVLKAYYEAEKERYKTIESREASHILLSLAAGSDQAAIDAVIAEANQLKDKISSGEDFAELAKTESTDSVSAKNGGALGEIFPGDLDQTLETTIYGLTEGDISAPIQTPQGIHLVQLTKINASKQQSYEESKTDLENEYRANQASETFVRLSDELQNLAFNSEDSLPDLSSEGIEIKSSEWLSSTQGAGIGLFPQIRDSAFSPNVLDNKKNSDVIELPDGRVVVLRLNEYKASEIKPKDDVTAGIKQSLLEKLSAEKNVARGATLFTELKDNNAINDIAVSTDSEVNSLTAVDRNSTEIDAEILNAAFKLVKAPEGSAFDGISLVNGDFALIEVASVISDEVTDEEIEGERQNYQSSNNLGEANAVVGVVEEHEDVELYREILARDPAELLGGYNTGHSN